MIPKKYIKFASLLNNPPLQLSKNGFLDPSISFLSDPM